MSLYYYSSFSAGVGRTGTFMAIDMALQQAEKEGIIDIIGIINKMRHKRMKMIQTVVSYSLWSSLLYNNFFHDRINMYLLMMLFLSQ